jgi:hypothetical protein
LAQEAGPGLWLLLRRWVVSLMTLPGSLTDLRLPIPRTVRPPAMTLLPPVALIRCGRLLMGAWTGWP